MANGVFNIAKGSIAEKIRDGANLIIVVLEAAEVDDTLNNYDTLDTLIAAVGNTEWTATNYARKAITNAGVTLTVDDTANSVKVDIADQTWTAVTGAASVKLLICEDGATDAARIPLTYHDFAVTPDGSDITAQIDANGFFGAS